jgi:hypothetical protein
MERIVVRFTERTALYLGQSASIDMERSSNTVSAWTPYTTRETRQTARTRIEHGVVGPDAANDTGDAPHCPNIYVTGMTVSRPSDGTHSWERTSLYLGQSGRPTWGCSSNTVSARMPLTTRETRHTARTSTLQTFRAPIVWRPSDGTHSRPIHGKDCDLSRTMRVDRHGTRIEHVVGPDDANDKGDAPHRPNVYVTNVPRANSVAPQ